jgi:hypothetical protein
MNWPDDFKRNMEEYGISFISKAEYEKMENEPALKVLVEEAHSIEHWPDHTFSTPDGRKFALFLWGDSIAYRLAAQSILGMGRSAKRKELHNIAGFFLEVDTEDPPFIFEKYEDLEAAWLHCHEMFGVPLCEEETDVFGLEGSDED